MMMIALFVASGTAAFVSPTTRMPVVQHRSTSPAALHASDELPLMYRKRWQNVDNQPETKKASITPNQAQMAGALLGASLMTAIGVGVSTVNVDHSLEMLSAAGLFDQSVLFTDSLMSGFDVADRVGLVALPLGAMLLMLKDNTESAVAFREIIEEEAEACLVDRPICGKASFDSVDGMVCIETYVQGKLRWECA
jgi:hypothetical protein